ncbi:MAG: carbamoyltransferase HypF [Candidatus Binatia bacterium]
MLDQHQRTTRGLRIRIEGSVQGVGFRPWVHGLARRQSVRGRIWNDCGCVTIEAFGDKASLGRFVAGLRRPPMPAARILALRSEPIPDESVETFAIVPSREGSEKRPSIPPDLATCPDCLREVLDPGDRRHRYAFTNCTRCGPRYTIALDVPYDRERTTMASFPMCEDCRAEYDDVGDRRFHAQPNACPACGPRLELVDGHGGALEGDPIEEAARLLQRGQIVAVKGLGGYHLACDAGCDTAVARLRSRKHRYTKPFAVMVASLADAESLARLGDRDRELLASAARPIVLVERRKDCPLAAGVCAGTPLVGLLLPYTPLHELLLSAFGGPLVMTSGNLSDEPMCIDDDGALGRLGAGVADALLRHDRAIAARCDDSIARVLDGEAVVLRRGRGWIPESLRVPRAFPRRVLACGAHLKNAFCLGAGDFAWMGPHVGDLETDEACAGFEEAVERFSRFVGIDADVIAHDLHPDYFSTHWAMSRGDCTRVAVQHHHAHVASAMGEHGLEGPVLGLAWDGTGDGGDGTAWGGELLAADFAGFRRLATLRPVALAGGDVAMREVWRIALALLDDAFNGEPPLERLALFSAIPRDSIAIVRRMIATGFHAPLAHGAGRYFDAFGAVVLGTAVSRHEGEVAMGLGFVADLTERRPYPFHVESAAAAAAGQTASVDLRPALRAAVEDVLAGRSAASVSGRFHATLAAVADEMVAAGLRAFGALPVVLSGGCFQNERLLADVSGRLSQRTRVYRHAKVPPNDGGIAFGQAMIAAAVLRGERSALGEGALGARLH